MQVHDVVIVGSGFAGAVTAWHLREAGVADIVVLEKEAMAGVHSSGRNACLAREHVREVAWQPLTNEGATFLKQETLASYDATGSMLLGLGSADVSKRVPSAEGRGLWCPEDGIVDVAGLLQAYLRGQDVRYDCALRGWKDDGEALRLETDLGPMGAKLLVNAAGAWAGEVGRLPLTPLNRHVFVTEPMATVDATWPFVWDVVNGLYFRPESGGLLLSPCDERPAPPGEYREDERELDHLAELVQEFQPGLGDLRIAHRWVGQRTFAGDRSPVIGFDGREKRIFHVAGLGGHGVTTSYAVGRIARDLILGRKEREAMWDPVRLLP